MLRRFIIVLTALSAFVLSATGAYAQETFCPPGVQPHYVFGFKDLHDRLVEQMGDPLTCEFPDPNATGDVHQITTEGLAFWRKSTNTPTFTNGWEHWAITEAGLVYWLGESIDPPQPLTASLPKVFSSAAIWDWHLHSDQLEEHCGVPFWELFPQGDPVQTACIIGAMRATGATDEAVRFFETTSMFLWSFEERGVVDTGTASASWFNMGRSHIVFLNGTPSVMAIFDVTPPDWETHPSYLPLIARYPYVFPWPEYAAVLESMLRSDGSQAVMVTYSMQECRACPTVAFMPVVLTFDPTGRLVGAEVLTPLLPES